MLHHSERAVVALLASAAWPYFSAVGACRQGAATSYMSKSFTFHWIRSSWRDCRCSSVEGLLATASSAGVAASYSSPLCCSTCLTSVAFRCFQPNLKHMTSESSQTCSWQDMKNVTDHPFNYHQVWFTIISKVWSQRYTVPGKQEISRELKKLFFLFFSLPEDLNLSISPILPFKCWKAAGQSKKIRKKNRSNFLNLVGLWCLERLLTPFLAVTPFLCS